MKRKWKERFAGVKSRKFCRTAINQTRVQSSAKSPSPLLPDPRPPPPQSALEKQPFFAGIIVVVVVHLWRRQRVYVVLLYGQFRNLSLPLWICMDAAAAAVLRDNAHTRSWKHQHLAPHFPRTHARIPRGVWGLMGFWCKKKQGQKDIFRRRRTNNWPFRTLIRGDFFCPAPSKNGLTAPSGIYETEWLTNLNTKISFWHQPPKLQRNHNLNEVSPRNMPQMPIQTAAEIVRFGQSFSSRPNHQ